MIETLTNLDLAALAAVNGQARIYGPVDDLVVHLAQNAMLKGVPMMMLFWYLWFLPAPDHRERRSRLTAVLLISIAALFVGRMLAVALPFRLRPIHSEGIEVILPYGVTPGTLDGWSSMPSDHAVMFFSMAAGLFLINRAVGSLALLHAVLVISLPRIYLGLHFPSDILVGALVGVVTVLLLVPPLSRVLQQVDVLTPQSRHVPLGYLVLFFLTFQWATMFNSLLDAAKVARDIGAAALT